MIMKARTEGMRALILFTMSCLDQISAGVDDTAKRELNNIVELITPICKAYCTEKGFDVCVRAIQVYGGYGYCKDYHVEQFARDCKITTIYEGANGIQGMDLLGRKIRMREGELFQSVASRINKTISEACAFESLSPYAKDFTLFLEALENLTNSLRRDGTADDYYLKLSQASAYLDIFGDILLGWIFLWQATVAEKKLLGPSISPSESLFCKEKIQTVKFYLGTMLPAVPSKIDAIKRNDRSLIEIRNSPLVA
jgi:hypothetical protein